MKRDEALKVTESAIENLAQALEQGESEALKRYLETMARFHKYSFGNSLMIHWQRPDATHVAGFQRIPPAESTLFSALWPHLGHPRWVLRSASQPWAGGWKPCRRK